MRSKKADEGFPEANRGLSGADSGFPEMNRRFREMYGGFPETARGSPGPDRCGAEVAWESAIRNLASRYDAANLRK